MIKSESEETFDDDLSSSLCHENEKVSVKEDSANNDIEESDSVGSEAVWSPELESFVPREKKFACDVCPFRTENWYDFRRHKSTHKGEKRGRAAGNLRDHIISHHSGDQPISCDVIAEVKTEII
ncbi:hypothetical protein GE061_020064 [Apolygus lucorum]|uniref:Uncharacterized protein n=1 Tax=Apolygus lucorum TaxID=248454 RepID=A0A6A4JYR6_APOLU|nr:hypothetical protein GE061_020064 [Apolygus lucorum]